MKDISQYYPPAGFSFKVVVEGLAGVNECSFQEVSGISVKIDPNTVEEGGENRFIHRYSTPPKYENLILKRGILLGSPIIKWVSNSIESFSSIPKIVNINLLDNKGLPIASWRFINAYPVAMKISELKANENTQVVETLELCYESFTRNIEI